MARKVRVEMMRRVHVFYSGRVQGVGFRVTAEDTARHLGVVGWVKNLKNSQVEVVAEAEEAVLRKFLEVIRTGSMKNFINRADVSWSNATDAFTEFDIRYY